MIYYGLIALSAVLFGYMFFFQQFYQNREGNALDSTLVFTLLTGIVGTVGMLFVDSRNLSFSWFTFAVAVAGTGLNFAYLFCSAKAFGKVNLSQYSLYAMLGGMILPVIVGALCYNEPMNVRRIVCVAVIAFALFLGSEGKMDKKSVFYCLAVFLLNGLSGVISKFHQSSPLAASSASFMLMKGILGTVIVVALLLFRRPKVFLKAPLRSCVSAFFYSLLCTSGNYILLISLFHVNASVQYPLVTGGTIVVALLISLTRKEKIGLKTWIAGALALGASILMM